MSFEAIVVFGEYSEYTQDGYLFNSYSLNYIISLVR